MPETRFILTLTASDGRQVSQSYSQADLVVEGLDTLLAMAQALSGGSVSIAVVTA